MMSEQRKILRLTGGGFIENGLMWSSYWDEHGAYLGQEQENASGDRGEPPVLIFRARGNEAGQFGLSREEMETAAETAGRVPEGLRPDWESPDA